jgi:hypothetical protein
MRRARSSSTRLRRSRSRSLLCFVDSARGRRNRSAHGQCRQDRGLRLRLHRQPQSAPGPGTPLMMWHTIHRHAICRLRSRAHAARELAAYPYTPAQRHGLGGLPTSRRLRRRVAHPTAGGHRPMDTPGCSPGSSTGSATSAPGPPSTPTHARQPHSTPPPSTRTSGPTRPVDCPTDVGAPHSGQHGLAGGRSRR